MSRNNDFSSMSLDELTQLIDDATSARTQKVEERRRELQAELEAKRKEVEAELDKLGGGKPPRMPAGLSEGRKRGSPKPVFRGPNGEEYSNRGPLPNWAKKLGISDKAGLEPYRIKD